MIYILHHGDSDGRFAGWCAWKHFNAEESWVGEDNIGRRKFIEVQYGKPFPIKLYDLDSSDEVYILDFSYPRAILDPVFERVKKLVVLDHHKTGVTNLAGASYGLFDKTKSGALLAWEYFFPNQKPPYVCALVNDYDLWTKKFEDTAAFEAYLQHERIGQDWRRWNELVSEENVFFEALRKGAVLYEQSLAIVNSFVKNPDNYIIRKDYLIRHWNNPLSSYVIYNGNSILRNELAEALYTKLDVDVTIQWRVRGKEVIFSIRSPNGDHFSAADFVEQHGGGGHDASAGFAKPLSEGLLLVQSLMGVKD